MALANAAGLRAGDAEPIDGGEYVFTLFLSAVWLWPVYMLLLLLLGRRGRFRVWAFALCPVLVVGMGIAAASLENPELQAALLACVLFAAAVTPPPGAQALKSTT